MSRHVREFERRIVAVDEAVSLIESDSDVVVAQCASEPQGCMAQFHQMADRVRNVKVFSVLTLQSYEFYRNPQMKGRFQLCSWFHAPGSRAALREGAGTVTYVPNMLQTAAMDRMAVRRPRVFFGTCTPPDRHGFVSLSLGVTYERDMIDMAEFVVLEVNENLPRTFGDTHVHVSQIDRFVMNTQTIPALPREEPSDVERAIGEHIASLVEDGATIQLGIGGIPNAVACSLQGKHDLGVHTEMFVDAMCDLYEAGVITNRKKTLHPDKMICTFAMGSPKLYEWLDCHPAIEFLKGRYVNDTAVIRQNARMVSINTCLTVDLQGQVASESIGPVQYSGTGGQTDTAVGARGGLDGCGKSVIACRSTAKNGTVSAIQPTLMAGTAVTLHRSHTDFVVTEFGVAALRGRSIDERANALIAISHPKFRDELTEEAKRLGFIL